jgi:NAD(P)-dependent dehydrogenase (short-subunit alcohol dehydrogenase family)
VEAVGRVDFRFSGCRVLVTGATSGIGAELAAAFRAAGAEVAITGTRASPADYPSQSLDGYRYLPLQARSPASVDAVAAAVGALDVLVNNAGVSLPDGKSEEDPDVFDDAVRINLCAANRLSRRCRDRLAQSRLEGGGNVINLASLSAFFGMPIVPGYGAAKAGLVQLTKTLAATWARLGIRVNAVAPGLIRTRMTEPMEAFPDLVRAHLDRTPLARWGTPADVAGAVLFLSSPAARFITGQTLAVDGGYSAV